MSAEPYDRQADPGYVRELHCVIRELVDAALSARVYVAGLVEIDGVSTTPRASRARRVLEELDGAIAEGQARV